MTNAYAQQDTLRLSMEQIIAAAVKTIVDERDVMTFNQRSSSS